MHKAILLVPVLMLAGACKPPPERRQSMPMADAGRGKAAIERLGCASCHSIEGIGWPRGTVGPAIVGMNGRSMIAGRIPNRPDQLALFVRDAPRLVPGTAMPAISMSDQDARDIAAYLYEIGG
ncbi:MAG: c-type cytochrome [Sphingomonas sp.]|nr:c-type cytochrome [Sphingomonas sp.]